MNKIKEIWLAGGCFWGMEEYFLRLNGVIKTDVGYANGKTNKTKYLLISLTDHAETVHIVYDNNVVTLDEILTHYFKIIDPTSKNKQGNDIGRQYRTGIYYQDKEDLEIIKNHIKKEQNNYNKPIVVDIEELGNYIEAEEYHQQYLRKNPKGYCHISLPDNNNSYLKEKLTEIQYHVTQENGTEKPFDNEYWDNHRKGIYVDIISREPLFSSSDKFDSACGWPSFSKPLKEQKIITKKDSRFRMNRIEVRSKTTNSHLGHVFNDGPHEQGGLRYCINSASLKFIPIEEMKKEGYESYIKFVK